MDRTTLPVPADGILVTHLVVAVDVRETSRFYSDLLGGEIVYEAEGAPTFVQLANTWVIVTEGGGPTPDKPDVSLGVPDDPARVNSFMNIRVSDIAALHEEWTKRGVEFVTAPMDNHGYELRCYVTDPDGRIIEVGQHTGMLALFEGTQPDE